LGIRSRRNALFAVLVLLGCSTFLYPTFVNGIEKHACTDSHLGTLHEGYSFSALHDPISIRSDGDFEKLGLEGNGTEAFPYLLQNLEIEAPKGGVCISILSTKAYFIISDCVFTALELGSGTGVSLEKVVNGRVENCSFASLLKGVSILKSELCVIESNVIVGCNQGIRAEQSIRLVLASNMANQSEYGIHLLKVDSSSVIRSTTTDCRYGLLIENSVSVNLAGNSMSGSSFALYVTSSTHCQSVGDSAAFSGFGIYFAFSQNCSLLDCYATWCGYGLYLLEIDTGLISNITSRLNRDYGVYLRSCRDVSLIGCYVLDNGGTGLYALEVTGAVIVRNELGYNRDADAMDVVGDSTKGLVNDWDGNAWGRYDGSGLKLVAGTRGSYDENPYYIVHVTPLADLTLEGPASGTLNWVVSALNPFSYSVLIDGIVQDEGLWDGSDISASFSNLNLGSRTFSVFVSTRSGKLAFDDVVIQVVDSTAPSWVVVPEDLFIEYGQSLAYQMLAEDTYGIADWSVNRSDFAITDGLLENSTALDLGQYALEIRAYDPSGNYVIAEIVVSVGDTSAPSVDSPDDIVLAEGQSGTITWSVSDSTPSRYEIRRNGTIVRSGEWTEGMTSIEIDIEGLSPGIYEYALLVEDRAGNVSSDIVFVVVEPATTTEPSSSTTTSTGTTSTGSTSPTGSSGGEGLGGTQPLLLIAAGIGVAGLVVMVLLVRVRRGKS
jgi:hypothetical protein